MLCLPLLAYRLCESLLFSVGIYIGLLISSCVSAHSHSEKSLSYTSYQFLHPAMYRLTLSYVFDRICENMYFNMLSAFINITKASIRSLTFALSHSQ